MRIILAYTVNVYEYNREGPVIKGTKVIRDIKEILSNAEKVPLEWETAFDAIQSDRVGEVKTTRKVILQPNVAKTITCLVRKSENIEAALTEKAISCNFTEFYYYYLGTFGMAKK